MPPSRTAASRTQPVASWPALPAALPIAPCARAEPLASLAHADPAADWLSCLSALGAQVSITGATGTRSLGLDTFVRGAMETALAKDELVTAVRIPRFSSR